MTTPSVKMEGIIDYPVDDELISAASNALQAQEKLSVLLRDKLKDNVAAKNAIDEGNALLDSLRHLKSYIEGTTFKFTPITLNKQELVHLKHLVVSHTPDNLQDDTKAKITEKLGLLFQGQVKSILYACLLTCPWFSCSQAEISGRAKNNTLFVVYVATNEQFFSLATQHEKELSETIDEPPIFATEVRHFCAQLQKGNVRCIEALCSPPEGVVMCSPEWLRLSSLINPLSLLHDVFVERCVGQAMGALVKKPLSGRLLVRDDATLTKYCDSFRLLTYADSAIRKEPLVVWRQVGGAEIEEEAEIVSLLQQAFEGLVYKEQLLDYVVRFKTRIEDRKEGVAKIEPHYWNDTLGEWLASVRMDGVKLAPPKDPPNVPISLRQLLDAEGLTSVHTRDVLVVAKGGSHMYNLATPTSDTDYIIVFREPTERIISSCFIFKESKDNRGQQSDVETAAYEVRLFCEMVLKGAVNMVELLYAENVEYASEYWHMLTRYKDSFMSEKVILQYIGFIKTHMKLFATGKHSGTPRERKLLYQVYHKLLSLERFVENGPPVVEVSGEERDFILRLRKGPLEGDLDKDKLYARAEKRLSEVREKLHRRTKRSSEFGNYRILQTWLLTVRGVAVKEPLKMTTPPLVA